MQEFIPSGRYLVSRHPGAPTDSQDGVFVSLVADAVTRQLEQVSLSDTPAEWWTVREVVEDYSEFGKCDQDFRSASSKAECQDGSVFTNNSCSWRTIDPNFSNNVPGHLSDLSSKCPRSRMSGDDFFTNESKTSSCKSASVAFNSDEIKERGVLSVMEEELYVKDRTAVWSKGIPSAVNTSPATAQRLTICTFSTETPIKHALWCTFYLEWPAFIAEEVWNRPDEPSGEALPSVCLIDSTSLRAFTEKGEDFRSGLPFQISGAWNTKYGLMLERQVSDASQHSFRTGSTHITDPRDSQHPRIYSLSHPLDDFCPVVFKCGPMKTTTSLSLKVIFTSCEPSICVAYDWCRGRHSVFLYRRLQLSEHNETTVLSRSRLSCSLARQQALQAAWCSSPQRVRAHSAAGESRTHSSATSGAESRVHSLATESRAPSPMAHISRSMSPAAAAAGGSGGWPASGTQQTNDGAAAAAGPASSPRFCLESVWSETMPAGTPASTAFLCTDMVAQR